MFLEAQLVVRGLTQRSAQILLLVVVVLAPTLRHQMALQEGREEALKLEVGVQQQEALEIKAATLHRKDMLEETTPMLLLTMALVVVVGQPPLVKMDLHLEVELVALEPLTLLQVLQLLMPEAVEVVHTTAEHPELGLLVVAMEQQTQHLLVMRHP